MHEVSNTPVYGVDQLSHGYLIPDVDADQTAPAHVIHVPRYRAVLSDAVQHKAEKLRQTWESTTTPSARKAAMAHVRTEYAQVHKESADEPDAGRQSMLRRDGYETLNLAVASTLGLMKDHKAEAAELVFKHEDLMDRDCLETTLHLIAGQLPDCRLFSTQKKIVYHIKEKIHNGSALDSQRTKLGPEQKERLSARLVDVATNDNSLIEEKDRAKIQDLLLAKAWNSSGKSLVIRRFHFDDWMPRSPSTRTLRLATIEALPKLQQSWQHTARGRALNYLALEIGAWMNYMPATLKAVDDMIAMKEEWTLLWQSLTQESGEVLSERHAMSTKRFCLILYRNLVDSYKMKAVVPHDANLAKRYQEGLEALAVPEHCRAGFLRLLLAETDALCDGTYPVDWRLGHFPLWVGHAMIDHACTKIEKESAATRATKLLERLPVPASSNPGTVDAFYAEGYQQLVDKLSELSVKPDLSDTV